jgi:N-formylmaleamate deformylase
MTAWMSGRIAITGGSLAYHRTGGNGPALVLAHGLTDNGLCWSRLAAALAPDFDIVMLDARGHGQSSRMPEGPVPDPAVDIASAMAALGLTAPFVMGHSMGARAMAAFAAAFPQGAAKVILEDPPFLPPADTATAAKRRDWLKREALTYQSLTLEEIAAKGKAASPGWHADEFPAWATSKAQFDPAAMPDFSAPWQEDIVRITSPALLIHGEPALGSLVPAGAAQEAAALNPNLKAVMIEGAGHNTRRENFEGVLAAVRGFLKG